MNLTRIDCKMQNPTHPLILAVALCTLLASPASAEWGPVAGFTKPGQGSDIVQCPSGRTRAVIAQGMCKVRHTRTRRVNWRFYNRRSQKEACLEPEGAEVLAIRPGKGWVYTCR